MAFSNLYEYVHDRIAQTGQDKYVKKLTTPAYLELFLHAQLQRRDGLQDIADDVLCKEFQQELLLESIRAAQLCRKHNQVDPDLLQLVFERLVTQILAQRNPAAFRKDMKIIDSTTFHTVYRNINGLCFACRRRKLRK